MPLSAGDKLGPYEIVARIGAGGMGDVYEARDTRWIAIVADQGLPKSTFTERWFEREAQVLASLNHSDIAQLFDIGACPTARALVMELVEGESEPKGPHAVRRRPGSSRRRCAATRSNAAHEKRDHASRSETGQHQDHARRHRQGAGFRPGEAGPECAPAAAISGDLADADHARHRGGHDPGDSRVHGAGAGSRQAGRQARRYLGLRRGAVRNADGQEAVSPARRSSIFSRRSSKSEPDHQRRSRAVSQVADGVPAERSQAAVAGGSGLEIVAESGTACGAADLGTAPFTVAARYDRHCSGGGFRDCRSGSRLRTVSRDAARRAKAARPPGRRSRTGRVRRSTSRSRYDSLSRRHAAGIRFARPALHPEAGSAQGRRTGRDGGSHRPFFSPDGQWVAFFAGGQTEEDLGGRRRGRDAVRRHDIYGRQLGR